MRFIIALLLLSYSIPQETIDLQKIFWGDATEFNTPSEIDYTKIVHGTPEYKSIKKNNITQGTAKYWILVSEANDHAVRVISSFGDESNYDLIALKGYLGGLDPPIVCDDITKIALKKLKAE